MLDTFQNYNFGLGMLRNVLARFGSVGGIDTSCDSTGQDGPKITEMPLGCVESNNVYNVSLYKPDGDESFGKLFNGLAVLLPRPRCPRSISGRGALFEKRVMHDKWM